MRCGRVIRVKQVLLVSIKLDGAKQNLGSSSKTCNEAVRGTCALTHCRSNRSDRFKLKW